MTALGYIHWFIALSLGVVFLWKEAHSEPIAKKPIAAALLLIVLGLALVFSEENSAALDVFDVLLFRTVNYGSTAIAIAYAFFFLGATKTFFSNPSSQSRIKQDDDDSNTK